MEYNIVFDFSLWSLTMETLAFFAKLFLSNPVFWYIFLPISLSLHLHLSQPLPVNLIHTGIQDGRAPHPVCAQLHGGVCGMSWARPPGKHPSVPSLYHGELEEAHFHCPSQPPPPPLVIHCLPGLSSLEQLGHPIRCLGINLFCLRLIPYFRGVRVGKVYLYGSPSMTLTMSSYLRMTQACVKHFPHRQGRRMM